MARKHLRPAHPGAIVRDYFIAACGVTPYRVAKDLGVTLPRVNDLVREKRAVSTEMGLLLARYFQTSGSFFLNLQSDYDRRIAHSALGKRLGRVKPFDPGDRDG